jgi:hypothetical protein
VCIAEEEEIEELEMRWGRKNGTPTPRGTRTADRGAHRDKGACAWRGHCVFVLEL